MQHNTTDGQRLGAKSYVELNKECFTSFTFQSPSQYYCVRQQLFSR